MNRRKKNNILIGVLCCALVFMGIGYAVLNATLNIGATANITGDFDIHFYSIERSSTSIQDSTLLSTMASGTGITNSPTNTTGQFTAVLQKPGDYVTYDVVVVNTGSIDGYLTFSFGDTNSNFDYYDDFYKVEFIREDTDPDIVADILQNQTFTDNDVLVKTSGTRTYKIKVTYKSTAESFPDATTNGAFGCTMNLTYSQSATGGNSGSGTGEETGLTWYTASSGNDTLEVALDENMIVTHYIGNGYDAIEDVEGSVGQIQFTAYNNDTIDANPIEITPQSGDYVWIYQVPITSETYTNVLLGLLHGDTLYLYDSDSNDLLVLHSGSGSGSSSSEEPEVNLGWKFKITNEGIITAYNYDYGTDVVVPATVNGITVTGIQGTANAGNTPHAFMGGNIVIYEDSGTYKAIITDATNYNEIKTAFLAQYGSVVTEANISQGHTVDAGDNIVMPFFYDTVSDTWKASAITSLDLSATSITSIPDAALYSALGGSLTSVTLPSTITSIGQNAFRGNTSLTDIYTNQTQAAFGNVTKGEDWNFNGATLHYTDD